MFTHKSTLILSAFYLFIISTGCSVYMAANQPEKKNTGILAKGTPRSLVIAELGPPVTTEKEEGKRTDIFTFHKGSDKGWKIGRAVFHGAADVVTLGLWELVGTPTEVLAKGDRVTATVNYDEKDRVESYTFLSGDAENESTPQTTNDGIAMEGE